MRQPFVRLLSKYKFFVCLKLYFVILAVHGYRNCLGYGRDERQMAEIGVLPFDIKLDVTLCHNSAKASVRYFCGKSGEYLYLAVFALKEELRDGSHDTEASVYLKGRAGVEEIWICSAHVRHRAVYL